MATRQLSLFFKRCTKCGEEKSKDDFYTISNPRYRNGKYLTSICKTCSVKNALAWNRANPDRYNASVRKWRAIHRAEDCAASLRWAREHPDQLKATHRQYYARNGEKIRAQALRWAKENRSIVNARTKARKLRQIGATPKWANEERMAEMYKLAARLSEETGKKHHVDHIVPITSKVVCGLHVEHNLQVMLGSDNIRKRNIHWPDMP